MKFKNKTIEKGEQDKIKIYFTDFHFISIKDDNIMELINNNLEYKTIEKIELDKKFIKIYFTDKITMLEVWGVERLHTGTGIKIKININNIEAQKYVKRLQLL